MPKAKHKPPSRERYEANNPTVSFRVSRELYEKLNEIREKTGKSYADIIKEWLGVQEPTIQKTYNRGYNAGHKEGMKLGHRVGEQFFLGECKVCGEQLKWDLDNNVNKNLLAEIINKVGVAHNRCD